MEATGISPYRGSMGFAFAYAHMLNLFRFPHRKHAGVFFSEATAGIEPAYKGFADP